MKKRLYKVLLSLGALSFIGTSAATVASCGTKVDNDNKPNDTSEFDSEAKAISAELAGQNIEFLQGTTIKTSDDIIGSGQYGVGSIIDAAKEAYPSIGAYTIGNKSIATGTASPTKRPIMLTVTFYSEDGKEQYTKSITFTYTIVKNDVPKVDTFNDDVKSIVAAIKALSILIDNGSVWNPSVARQYIQATINSYTSILSFTVKSAGNIDTTKSGNQNTSLDVVFVDKNDPTINSEQNIPITVSVKAAPKSATFADDVITATAALKTQTFTIDFNSSKTNTYGTLKTILNGKLPTVNYGTVNNINVSVTVATDIFSQTGGNVANDSDSLTTFGSTQLSVNVKFTSKDASKTQIVKVALNFNLTKYEPNKPDSKTVFSPYVDISLAAADQTLADAHTFIDNNHLPKLPSTTLAFLNYNSQNQTYSFAGNSVEAIKAKTIDKYPDTQVLIASGGAYSGGADAEVPGQDPNVTPQDAAASVYNIVKQFKSKIFDWDLEGTVSTTGDNLKRIVQTATILKSLADKDGYDLKQMVTVSGDATWDVNVWPIQLSKVTPQLINNAPWEQYLTTTGQNARGIINDFYAAGIDPIANIMTMNFGTWKMNYDASVPLGMGATKNYLKTLRPTWTDAQAYAHVGITPMIGVQDTTAQNGVGPYDPNKDDGPTGVGSGYFTFDKGAVAASYWAKTLNIGYMSYWSLGRDKPGALQKEAQNYDYGMTIGSEFIYTKTFLEGLFG